MLLSEASGHVLDMLAKTKVVFLRTEPEVLDFTCRQEGKLYLSGGGRQIEITITPDDAIPLLGFLSCSVLDKNQVTSLIGWNVKALMSYFRFFVPKTPSVDTQVLDLKVIENFLGREKRVPENIAEAVNRVKETAEHKSWKLVYRSIHLPLLLRVLPAIETAPIVDVEDRTSKHAYYEIEGQKNGRLGCSKKFSKSFLPHTLDVEQKKRLRPKAYDQLFLTFDIRHCEVNVLQWLSKDETLESILRSGKDLYREIYQIVTGDLCESDKKRNLTKLMFLPVMYGCSHHTLGKNLNIGTDVAKELIARIRLKFATAYKWMEEVQQKARQGTVEDYFGRPRSFAPEECYKARNQAVQGVAATVCLEKLIALYDNLTSESRLCLSVHDGYGLVLPEKAVRDLYHKCNQVFEQESELCPGLFLPAECRVGRTLGEMEIFGKSN